MSTTAYSASKLISLISIVPGGSKIVDPALPCDEVHIILATNVHNSECGEVVNPFGKLEVQSVVSASVVETAHPRARKKNVVNPVLRSLRRLPRGAALLAERGGG